MEGGATGNGGAGALKMPEIWAESTCSHEPPTMSSEGVWSSYRQYGSSFWIGILQHPIPLLELQLFVIFFLHYLLHFLHTRLKLPWLFIHGLVGFIIGQVLRSNQNLSKLALNDESETVITTLMSIGFALFMFISGVKVDPSMMIKSGKQALTMGTLALFFPIILTTPLFEFMKRRFPYSQIGLRFFAFSQSLTPFPVIACLLTDLKILNSELGRLTSSSSLISYLISFALMAMFIFFRVSSEISVLVGFKVVVVCMAFTCSLWVFVRPLMFWIIKQTPEGKPVRESYIVFIVVLAVLSAVISDFVGLEYMFGPFILGLVIPDGPPLGSTLAERLDTVISGVVVPLFMTYGGYRITFQTGLNHIFMAGICGIVLLTVLGKLIAGVLTAWLCNIPYKDAFVISIIMSAKGIVDICLYITCNDKKVHY
ncbi:cation/H(+) antiporter 8-like [Malania oleifera]|uniref:cation/H(+) antiporter 8-like n=1 Tax=Malania oleifera TaxID=397392 RepID=UPI0025AE9EE0|nr:cation/H(+) antiporter 8-like [Malania oleifera]